MRSCQPRHRSSSSVARASGADSVAQGGERDGDPVHGDEYGCDALGGPAACEISVIERDAGERRDERKRADDDAAIVGESLDAATEDLVGARDANGRQGRIGEIAGECFGDWVIAGGFDGVDEAR